MMMSSILSVVSVLLLLCAIESDSSPVRGIGRHVRSDMLIVRNPYYNANRRAGRSQQQHFDVPIGK